MGYLIATSGDLAAGGMGAHDSVIEFDDQHMAAVEKYLKASHAVSGFTGWTASEPARRTSVGLRRVVEAMEREFQGLLDLGIFDNKWQARTAWRLEGAKI